MSSRLMACFLFSASSNSTDVFVSALSSPVMTRPSSRLAVYVR
jgi:hypothetical protein